MKFKPRSRAMTLAIVGTTALALTGTGLAAAVPNHAFADPDQTYIAVGSDTTQNVVDQLGIDLAGNDLGSFDAVNPLTQAIGETITPVRAGSPPVTCSFTRPDGSGQGLNALRKSINQSTSAPQLTTPPQAGCIDFSRSSSGPASANLSTNGALIYVPFALDAVGIVASSATTIAQANNFTTANLQALYNCNPATVNGVTYSGVTPTPTGDTAIDLYIPQSGSGTLSFWANQMGFSTATLPTCLRQTIAGTSTAVEENDGSAVTADPIGIMPFSIAQWIAQRNGHSDRRHSAVEKNVNATSPFDNGNSATGNLNPAWAFTRQVYNIVQFSRVSGSTADAGLVSMLVGPNSFLCQDQFTILGYGFALLGSTTPNTCGQLSNSLRVFDPATNPV